MPVEGSVEQGRGPREEWWSVGGGARVARSLAQGCCTESPREVRSRGGPGVRIAPGCISFA